MTKEELKALVASGVKGQGNQVDTGNALGAILDGIIDLIQDRESSLVWDITALGEIADEVTIPDAILANYNGQQAIKTILNGSEIICLFIEATSEHLKYSDNVSTALWVKYNGKIKPADS